MTLRLARPWHTLFVVVLTATLLWLFIREIDLRRTWQHITEARVSWLIGAVSMTFVTYVLRATRWLALLAPLGPARFRTAFRTTVIGFTASYLLPLRPGEVLRAYLLARQEGLSAPATFATVVVERALDLTVILLLFAASIPFVASDMTRDPALEAELRAASISFAVFAVLALGALVYFAGHPDRLARLAAWIVRFLPAKAREATLQLARVFSQGLVIMRRPMQLVGAILWTVLLWVSITLGVWMTSLAFDLTVSLGDSFLVMAFLTVGVSLPTPGGLGGFQYFYTLAVTNFFGATPDAAAAAAIVLHAVSFVPVTLGGLIFMWQDGLTLTGLKRMRSTAAAAEGVEGS
jgi:uncharacterized protein (TIRG00374 family)